MRAKTMFFAALVFLLPFEAGAIAQLRTTTASCDRVQALLDSEGAAILRWQSLRQPGLPRYGRFVSSSRFCTPGEGAFAAFVPAADDESCRVYECRAIDPDDPILTIPQR